jgi:hypothetical protein
MSLVEYSKCDTCGVVLSESPVDAQAHHKWSSDEFDGLFCCSCSATAQAFEDDKADESEMAALCEGIGEVAKLIKKQDAPPKLKKRIV